MEKRRREKRREPTTEEWLERFGAYLDQSRYAWRALRVLVAGGCDRNSLLTLLHLAGRRARTDYRAGLAKSGWTGKRLKGVSRRLQSLTGEIELLNRVFFLFNPPISQQGGQIVDDAERPPSDSVAFVLTRLPLLLRIYDQFLVNRKGLPNQRDAGNYFLVNLAQYVKSKTGETHYGKIAYLMGAAVAGYGKTVDITPQSVARKCQRYKKKYPGLADPFLTLETPSR